MLYASYTVHIGILISNRNYYIFLYTKTRSYKTRFNPLIKSKKLFNEYNK